MVKILFFPFLLLVVCGMAIFIFRHRKLPENRKAFFLFTTMLVMVVLRLALVGSTASRYYIVLLIPGIPFAAYLWVFPGKLNVRLVNTVFFVIVCICIGKALKPRHSKAYILEISNTLNAIVHKSGASKLSVYDFSGETRRLRFHSGFAVQAVGEICESPEQRIRQLNELVGSRSSGKGAVYFIFREKGLKLAREIYLRKNGKPLPVREIFRSESKRNDGSCYVIVRLRGTKAWKW
ncbi:MAG: hypothetical protein WCS27_02455 [Victivallaceae bacterium]